MKRALVAAVAVLAHLSYRAAPALCHLLQAYPRVVTVEEGTTAGGLGSLTAEAIAEHALPCQLSMQGVRGFVKEIGSTEYLRGRHGLDAVALAGVAEHWLSRREAA